MLFLDLSTRKEYDENTCTAYLDKRKVPVLNCIKHIVGNGAFARNEQMLHFPQYMTYVQ